MSTIRCFTRVNQVKMAAIQNKLHRNVCRDTYEQHLEILLRAVYQ